MLADVGTLQFMVSLLVASSFVAEKFSGIGMPDSISSTANAVLLSALYWSASYSTSAYNLNVFYVLVALFFTFTTNDLLASGWIASATVCSNMMSLPLLSCTR